MRVPFTPSAFNLAAAARPRSGSRSTLERWHTTSTFSCDLNSPYSWLAAERINSVLLEPPVWQPISYSHVVQHTGVPPWSVRPGREVGMREIERRAAERGL